MHPKIQKAFKVSDGLASLVHKKVTGLVREMESEEVLTKQEGQKVIKGLANVKKALYDSVSSELKKILDAKAKKKAGKKKR